MWGECEGRVCGEDVSVGREDVREGCEYRCQCHAYFKPKFIEFVPPLDSITVNGYNMIRWPNNMHRVVITQERVPTGLSKQVARAVVNKCVTQHPSSTQ